MEMHSQPQERKKGVNAGKANKSLSDNPYEKPTDAYKETHSRSAYGAWICGYQSTKR